MKFLQRKTNFFFLKTTTSNVFFETKLKRFQSCDVTLIPVLRQAISTVIQRQKHKQAKTCALRQLLDNSKPILCPRFENLNPKIHYFFTLQTRRLSSLVGWWWTASGGKVRNQITLIKTWTSTIPVQIQSWDFGEIKLGLLADCVEALKIREIRLVFVNRAP